MNVDHKDILIDNFTYLKDNITFTDSILLDTLQEAAVMDQQEVDDVRSKVTDRKGTDQLLQYILRSSYEQYQQFLEALNKSKHQHVFKRLTGLKFYLSCFRGLIFTTIRFHFSQFFLNQILNIGHG